MSVVSELYKVTVVGDGSTPSIAFNRKVFASSDIKGVKYDTTTLAETVLVNGSDFTISGAGNESTSVTITPSSDIPTGTNWVIYSDQGSTQTTDLQSQGPFPANTIEYMSDKLAIAAQEVEGKADRSLKLPISDSASSEIPNKTSRASKYLGFDSSGDPVALAGGTATTSADISYLHGATGSVSQTVENKLQHVVHVEDFGAVGNGSTDDTAAIQAAIDWAESQKPDRGGTVLLGPNRYATTAPLIIDDEGVTIQGAGTRFFSVSTTSSIIGSHTNGPIIHVKASSTRLKGFRIDSSGSRLPANAYTSSQGYDAPAIGTTTGRNDGIHCVAPNNGAGASERMNYVCIEGMHVRGQPGSGLIITGNSVGCNVSKSIFEYNNSHGIYIGRGDEAGYTHTGGNRVGLLSIRDCRTSDNGGNNMLIGDVIASNAYIPYRLMIDNHESFRGGLESGNRHDSLDFDLVMIMENSRYAYGACQGREDGGSGEGNGMLVAGRNIVLENNRHIDCEVPIRIAAGDDANGSLSADLTVKTEAITVSMPYTSNTEGVVAELVKVDNRTEFASLGQAPENIKIYSPYQGDLTTVWNDEQTIISGSIDYIVPYVRVDTESDAAADNLDNIEGGTFGDEITIFQENASRTVTVRHNGGGSGNLRLAGSTSLALGGVQDNVTLLHDGTRWIEKTRTVI